MNEHFVCSMLPYAIEEQVKENSTIETVELFIRYGTDINKLYESPMLNDARVAPLHVVSMYGENQLIEMLLRHGANIDLKASNGSSPLMLAIVNKQYDSAKKLISYGADVNSVNTKRGITPLMMAAYHEDLDMVKLLIEKGADVMAVDDEGYNVLHHLLSYSYEKLNTVSFPRALPESTRQIVMLLLEHGISIDEKNSEDQTPLEMAIAGGWEKMVRFLLEQGISTKLNDEGAVFVRKILPKLFKELKLQIEFDIDKYSKAIFKSLKTVILAREDINDFLPIAVMLGDIELVKWLIRHGADVSKGNLYYLSFLNMLGVMPYMFKQLSLNFSEIIPRDVLIEKLGTSLASNYKPMKMIELLVEHGAKEKGEGITVWMSVVMQQDCQKIRYLISRAKKKKLRMYLAILIFLHRGFLKDAMVLSEGNVMLKEIMTQLFSRDVPIDLYPRIIQALIDGGLDLSKKNKKNILLLDFAIILKDVNMIKILLEYYPDITIKDEDGFRPIDYAYAIDDPEIRTLLIQHGADVSQRKTDKKSLKKIKKQIKQSDKEFRSLIAELSDERFDDDEGDNQFKTWLSIAMESQKPKDLKKAIREGSRLESVHAVRLVERGYGARFIRLAVQNGMDKDGQDAMGQTALMHACRLGRAKTVETLIRLGARIDITDRDGYDAWHYASLAGGKKAKIIDLLERYETLSVSEHNPLALVKILSNFTHDTPIKYTTHGWDFGDQYENCHAFLESVGKQWDEIDEPLKELSPNLYRKIERFLFAKEPAESWCSTDDIRIGWSSTDGLHAWCDEGNDPWEFPLESSQITESAGVRTFGEVIRRFKQEIEIRSDDNMLENIFIQFQKDFGKDFGRAYRFELIKLKGRNFYTDVEQFRSVLRRIFSAIKDRAESDAHKQIRVEVIEPDEELIELRITHIGSHADLSADAMKQQIEKGDFKIMRENLKHLCYWSIEDRYDEQGYRVNYLKKTDENESETLETLPEGFTHVMRFYKK